MTNKATRVRNVAKKKNANGRETLARDFPSGWEMGCAELAHEGQITARSWLLATNRLEL